MRIMTSLALALGAAVLGGAPVQAAAKDSLTIGMVLEPTSLDPTIAAAAAIGEITHDNIYEGLTKIEADFSLSPQLAEKWTFSPDLKSLTFALRHNAYESFQDGEALHLQGREVFTSESAPPPRRDSTNKEKAFFGSIDSVEASVILTS